MGKVLSISEKFVTAIDGGDMPTFKVVGMIGEDFSGADLASVAELYNDGSGVRFILDTPGGVVHDAFHFYDYVRANGLKVYMDGYGRVMSAGSILMAAAGRKRSRLGKNTEYMIHNTQGAGAERAAMWNMRIANVLAEVCGKTPKEVMNMMKAETFLMAEDARKMGFVGEVIGEQKLAANADKTKNMEDKKTVAEKRVFAVKPADALAAVVSGKIEVEVDVDAEAATQLTAYAAEVKELTTAKDELTAEVSAKDEAITAAATEVAKLQATHIEIEERATKAEAEVVALKAEVTKLKTTPIAEPVKAKGEDVVDPAAPVIVEPVKMTASEKHKATQSYLTALKTPQKTN